MIKENLAFHPSEGLPKQEGRGGEIVWGDIVSKSSSWSRLSGLTRFSKANGYSKEIHSCYGNKWHLSNRLFNNFMCGNWDLIVDASGLTCAALHLSLCLSHSAAEEAEATVQGERRGQEAEAAQSPERSKQSSLTFLLCSLLIRLLLMSWCCFLFPSSFFIYSSSSPL